MDIIMRGRQQPLESHINCGEHSCVNSRRCKTVRDLLNFLFIARPNERVWDNRESILLSRAEQLIWAMCRFCSSACISLDCCIREQIDWLYCCLVISPSQYKIYNGPDKNALSSLCSVWALTCLNCSSKLQFCCVPKSEGLLLWLLGVGCKTINNFRFKFMFWHIRGILARHGVQCTVGKLADIKCNISRRVWR